MKKTLLFLSFFLLPIIWNAAPVKADDGDKRATNAIIKTFALMEKALAEKNESLFKAQWHPKGYARNLVGKSGIAGRAVFTQGTRQNWYPKAEIDKMEKHDGVYVVPSKIWHRQKNRAINRVYGVLVPLNKQWVALGGGENKNEVLALAKRYLAKPIDTKISKAIEKTFTLMNQALLQKNETLFKKQWHPKGYAHNLVGDSGIPGRGVFSQGTRKNWYPNPEMDNVEKHGNVYLVPCKIWHRKKNRAVDHVYGVLVPMKKRWVLLGGGEKKSEALSLAHRYQNQKPLMPKSK